jgi:predicted transcriptional regulator of viral defense system
MTQKGRYLETILRSPKTVFTLKDVALLWGEPSTGSTRVRLSKYVKNGKLYRVRRGIYAKDENYSKLELATRIFVPSYVSFETVLAREGLIFQFYTQVKAASYLTRDIEVDGQTYSFKKIKTPILTNSQGVENRDETSLATKERAFLDTLYIHVDYHFDNLNSLDWNSVFKILPIYHNQRMADRVHKLYKQITHSNEK